MMRKGCKSGVAGDGGQSGARRSGGTDGYDNGAAAPSGRIGTKKKNKSASGNDVPQKSKREKSLEKELVEERMRSALMMEELRKTRDDMRMLKATVEKLQATSQQSTSGAN
nr:uncharacterized protein LOC115260440 [Aedes albopictus]